MVNDARAQPLVLDGVAQVELHVADQAHRQLQDMRGGRRTVRQAPAAIDPRQGGFLLRPGDGDPEVIVVLWRGARHGRRCHGAAQDRGHLGLVERACVEGAHVAGCPAVGQDLQRTDAVPSNFGEQVEGLGGSRTEATRGARADVLAVRQQVFEIAAENSDEIRLVRTLQHPHQTEYHLDHFKNGKRLYVVITILNFMSIYKNI